MTWFMQSWEKNYEYKEMMGINVFLGDLNAATMVGDVLRMGIDLNIELPSGSNKVQFILISASERHETKPRK